ncbi:LysR family transcriptional regulator [Amylibacter marinus]|uniref:LysR family transcriptional regulator n=2 Tax=Amylibacter marinus TaxID=1475483 RepID=A0ABQ5VUG0_9RHOB|nr:LysR family transcriptional regulator [Amylibacter marinus]
MDVSWDDLKTVMMLVRHQSLAGAGAALGVNYTTVARRIKRAEDILGVLLFERLPEGYSPTDAALKIAKDAGEMEEIEHSMRRKIQGADAALSGPLTITAPQLLIANFLAPVIDGFINQYPQIELRVLATNELLDLTRLEADLAIRISNNPGDTLKGLRLLRQENAGFASPQLAHRIARNPKEMVDWIVYDEYPNVPVGIHPYYPNNQVRLRLNDMVAIIGAARAGTGVARLPLFLGRSTQGLVQVPVLPPQKYLDIWVVGHPDAWKSQKQRVFREALVGYCKKHRAQFVS